MPTNNPLSRSAACGCKVLAAVMRLMNERDGSVASSDLRSAHSFVQFNAWELEDVNGSPRWWNFLSFYSTCYVVAGFITKQRGTWHLTDAGAAALNRPAEDVFREALHVYKVSRSAGSSSEPVADDVDDVPAAPSNELIFEDLKQRADDGIRRVLAGRSPYEFQEMVAALLRAMGYFVPFVAPRGRDGGIDVLAYRDVLGATTPRIKVQVKHMPSSSVSVEVVRQLIALLNRDGDAGLVVTSGTFTGEAHREARQSHRGIRLIDGDEFIDLWVSYYDKLSEQAKEWLRLTPVYVVSE